MATNKTIITYAIIGMLLVFGFYSSTINYAHAVSVVSVTFPTGSTELDVSYATGIFSDNNDTTSYIIGANAGVAYVWKKSGSGITENTIIANATLTGSGSARAIEFHPDIIAVYAVTNDKFYKLTTTPIVSLDRAEGIANIVRQLHYEPVSGNLYFCTNDSFGTVNLVTLAPTTLYTDAGNNAVLDCAFDGTNGFAYLTGTSVGVSFHIVKVSLSTFTVVDSATVNNFLFGVCYDSNENFIWATESSDATIHKYNDDLVEVITPVTVGTTPRFCSISDGDNARRLYVANEGTDNVSIVDIDANVVLNTPNTCNQGVTTPRIDTKRLFNTTNTFIPCPEVTSSVIIDDTVSQEFPSDDNIVGGINCSLPENANILICRLAENEGQISGASDLVNGSVTTIICQIGLIACTDFEPDNPDIKTNGVGYILTAIALGIFVSILWLASDGRLTEIPTFIWFIGSIAVIGAITAIGWIDPTFLVVSIIAIVALATAKAKSILGDNSLFKGEI